MEEITLENLAGIHYLSGFDPSIPDKPNMYGEKFEDGLCFILDDKKYQVYTDSADGYRSYCSEVFQEDVVCNNVFEPIKVLINYKNTGKYEACDIIEMYSTKTGNLIATIGTENTDDYYPYVVNELEVENLDKELKEI